MTAPLARRVRIGGAVVVALMSLLSAACGEEEPATATVPQAAAALPSGTFPTAGTTRSSDTAYFQLPSANIGCHMQPTWVRCDIQAQTYALPPKPPACQGLYGKSLRLDRRKKAELLCAADTLLPAPETVEYDTAVVVARMRCVVQESGVTCHDTESGFGFALSRQEYRFLAPS
jgi:hypothetical protein